MTPQEFTEKCNLLSDKNYNICSLLNLHISTFQRYKAGTLKIPPHRSEKLNDLLIKKIEFQKEHLPLIDEAFKLMDNFIGDENGRNIRSNA